MLEKACVGISVGVDEDNDVASPLNIIDEVHDFCHRLLGPRFTFCHDQGV
jgi:hypothetical protein